MLMQAYVPEIFQSSRPKLLKYVVTKVTTQGKKHIKNVNQNTT